MSWFGKLIGTDEAFKTGASIMNSLFTAIDKAFYTEQEKAELTTKALLALQDQYMPRSISRRILAFIFCSNFCLILWVTIGLIISGKDEVVTEIIKLVDHFELGWITLTIVIFYFGNYIVDRLRK